MNIENRFVFERFRCRFFKKILNVAPSTCKQFISQSGYFQWKMLRTVKSNKSKGNTAAGKAAGGNKNAKGQPSLEDFIIKRDYTGALTLLEFRLKCQDGEAKDLLLWIGYCAFHIGNYKRAEEAYRELLTAHDVGRIVHLYIACCYFFQQMYEEAEKEAEMATEDPLKTRILFHVAHRLGDETKLMTQHQKLHETKLDFLSLAAVHFLRSHHHDVSLDECPSIFPFYAHLVVNIGHGDLQAVADGAPRRHCSKCVRRHVLFQVGYLRCVVGNPDSVPAVISRFGHWHQPKGLQPLSLVQW